MDHRPPGRERRRHDDDFGKSLAAADFDGDGYADLAIGVPGKAVGGTALAGIVEVLRGGPDGLSAAGSVALDRSMTGAASDRTAIWFGFAIAAGDVDGDGTRRPCGGDAGWGRGRR